jgi:large subunit ribosomal protein L15
MPMQRRLPKRGFTPLTRKEYTILNLTHLDSFPAGSEVTVDELIKAGLVKDVRDGIKILADGEIAKSLKVKVHKFSAAAKEKITAAGGSAEEI